MFEKSGYNYVKFKNKIKFKKKIEKKTNKQTKRKSIQINQVHSTRRRRKKKSLSFETS